MVTHLKSTSTKHGPMTIVNHIFNTGIKWQGKMIQVRETFSTLAGRTLHSWQVRLENSVCWIGDFSTARNALDFYRR